MKEKCGVCKRDAQWRAVILPIGNTEYLCIDHHGTLDERGDIYVDERISPMLWEEQKELVDTLNEYERTATYKKRNRRQR